MVHCSAALDTSSLLFTYEMREADSDINGIGIGIGANRLRVSGGGIFDNAGNAADLSHSVIPADPNQMVGRSLLSSSQ